MYGIILKTPERFLFSFLSLSLQSYIYILKINKPRSKQISRTNHPVNKTTTKQQQNYLGSTTQSFLAGEIFTSMVDFLLLFSF